jgi:glutaconate CoA-transferase, subunit A
VTSKLLSMHDAIAAHIPDGSSVALGLQMEQMIPFSAGHEMMRQGKRDLTLIGPIFDIIADQLIGAGCVKEVIGAWIGNVMMGSAYNFRREVESGRVKVTNLSNFSVALALQAGAMGVPFLPMRSALGSDIAKGNPFFKEIEDPFFGESDPQRLKPRAEAVGNGTAEAVPFQIGNGTAEDRNRADAFKPRKLHAVRALIPDVTIMHVQRADAVGNAHCWGNFGVMLEGVRAVKKVIVIAEEIVAPEVIASDPNRTVIPSFLVTAVVESPLGAHPSPVQGYYKRDDAFFMEYHKQSKAQADFENWAERWVHSVAGREGYNQQLGAERVASLGVKKHAYAAQADYGY